MKRLLRWVTPVLLAVQITLVVTGVLSVGQAAVIIVVVEVALLAGGLTTIGVGRRQYGQARQDGVEPWPAFVSAVRGVLPAPVALVLLWEAGTVRNLWLAARGRIDGAGSAAQPLPYDAGMGALMGAMTGLALVEIAVVHLIVPWPVVRVVLLVIGIWTVLIVLGFWAGLRTHPHLITDRGLRLRYAHYLDILIDWDELTDTRRAHLHEPASVTVRDDRLHLPVSSGTNLLVTLAASRPMPLLFRRSRPASEIAFQVDDPAEALREISPRLHA